MTERKVLVFRVAGQLYAVDIQEVREVIAAPEVTLLPKARAPVLGVFNLRGNIVTAVDGGLALGVGEARGERRSRAIVADVDGHLLGVLVDGASEVLTVNDEDVKPTPALSGRDRSDISRGVVLDGERAIVLLSLKDLREQAAVKTDAGPVMERVAT